MLLAALVINESITEAKKLNLPQYIAFLDSQKAFDVVDHQSLKCKLNQKWNFREELSHLLP
jgi:hypothetical protein